MKTCKLCHLAIEPWQSYQSDLDSFVHVACALGGKPKPAPVARLKGNEWVTFTPDEPRHRHHVDTDKDTS